MSTRMRKQLLKSALISGFVASSVLISGLASAINEVEPNDTYAQAQLVPISAGGASISAMMGTGGMTTDLDLFAIDASEGDVPVISVVSDGAWDPFLVLYDSAGVILDMNDDAYPMNPESTSPFDSRIELNKLVASGRYYIAVTPVPRYLSDNFQPIFTDAGAGGSYKLVIQGVTATTSAPDPDPAPDTNPPPSSGGSDANVVAMQVLHWHGDEPQLGKFRGKDPIPVAIMSSPDFDAMSIDQTSLRFGATGSENSLLRCGKKGKDVKMDRARDGRKDLVCYFRPDVAGFKDGDVQAFLEGKTVNGNSIKASAALRLFSVSSVKRESWHERHNVDPRGKNSKSKNGKRVK